MFSSHRHWWQTAAAMRGRAIRTCSLHVYSFTMREGASSHLLVSLPLRSPYVWLDLLACRCPGSVSVRRLVQDVQVDLHWRLYGYVDVSAATSRRHKRLLLLLLTRCRLLTEHYKRVLLGVSHFVQGTNSVIFMEIQLCCYSLKLSAET